MSHPLHEQAQMIECSYVFGLTAKINEEYWEIHLKTSEETRNFVKKHLWTSNPEDLKVELSINNRNAIITFPGGIVRTVATSKTNLPERTDPEKIKRIHRDIERRKKRAEFHKLLEKLGIQFDIDFYKYKEESDNMTVYLNGKKVYSGTTDDLQTIKPPK